MMKKLLLVLVIFLFGCSSSNYQTVDVDTVYKASLEDTSIIILDVRESDEYYQGHIKNAINIPVENIETIDLDKDKTIYVYCASGKRSKTATNKLIDMGYTNVYDMGGIDNYPYELEQ